MIVKYKRVTGEETEKADETLYDFMPSRSSSPRRQGASR